MRYLYSLFMGWRRLMSVAFAFSGGDFIESVQYDGSSSGAMEEQSLDGVESIVCLLISRAINSTLHRKLEGTLIQRAYRPGCVPKRACVLVGA